MEGRMTAQQLKNSILQMAVQGKLVPQDANDEPASVLLERIRKEKEQLIKDGKIKKNKKESYIFRGADNLHYEQIGKEVRCIEDELPFEIPDGWEWNRWGNMSFKIQYGYNAPAKEKGNIKMVRISDIQDNAVIWENVPFCNIDNNEIEDYILHNNDILFARTGGTVGKSFLVDNIKENAVFAGYLIRTVYDYINLKSKYLKYFMESNLYWSQLRKGTIATAQPNCNGQTLSSMFIPIPPLEEQKRIINKIKELEPLIEKYKQTEEHLYALNSNIKEQLKKSILQYAIEGKLVPQDPNDEPASVLLERIYKEKQKLITEGKIKKDKNESIIYRRDNSHYEKLNGIELCVDEEIPFEIPESWEWVRLKNLVKKEIKRGKSPEYSVSSNIQVFAQKCNVKAGGIDMTLAKYLDNTVFPKYPKEEYMRDSDIVVNSTGNGTLGRIGMFHDSDRINKNIIVSDSHVTVIRTSKFLSADYIFYVLNYYQPYLEKSCSGSTNQTELKPAVISELFIPVPPINEQRRIVNKLSKTIKLLTE